MRSRPKRNSNYEFLRIVSMLLIMFGHLGMFTHYGNIMSFGKFYGDFLWLGAKIGVNIFVLISAFFLSKSTFKKGRINKLWITTIMYSWLNLFIIKFFTPIHLKKVFAFDYVFPVITGVYWFITAYIIMVLLSPYINILIKNITKKQYQFLLLTMFLFCSVFVALFGLTSSGTFGNDSTWLIFVYLIGGYIRKYEDSILLIRNNLLLFLILICSSTMVMLVFLPIVFKVQTHRLSWFNWSNGYSPLSLIISVSIFILVTKKTPKYNDFINNIAGSMLDEYLLWSPGVPLLPFYCNKVVKMQQFNSPIIIVLYSIFVIASIFILGLIVSKTMKFLYPYFELVFKFLIIKVYNFLLLFRDMFLKIIFE